MYIILFQGNRTTPSYVAFTDTERLIGDAAKNQVAMNPSNTVFGKPYATFFLNPADIIHCVEELQTFYNFTGSSSTLNTTTVII